MSFFFELIELRLFRYKYRKRIVKVIVIFVSFVVCFFFLDMLYFVGFLLGLVFKNYKFMKIMIVVRLIYFIIFVNNFKYKIVIDSKI